MYTVAPYSLKKMENSRFKSTFLDNYYMLENKKYLIDVKPHQVPLLLQQWRFKIPKILPLKKCRLQVKFSLKPKYPPFWNVSRHSFVPAKNAGLSSHRPRKLNNSKWPLSKFFRHFSRASSLVTSSCIRSISSPKYGSKSWIFHF
jgi:hypothetical protein